MGGYDSKKSASLEKVLSKYTSAQSRQEAEISSSATNAKFASLFSNIESYKSASIVTYEELVSLYCDGIKSYSSLMVAKYYILQALKGFHQFRNRTSILKTFNSTFSDAMRRFDTETSSTTAIPAKSTVFFFKNETDSMINSVREIFDNRPYMKNRELIDPAVLKYKFSSGNNFSSFDIECNPLYFTEEMDDIGEIKLSFSGKFGPRSSTYSKNNIILFRKGNKEEKTKEFISEEFSIIHDGVERTGLTIKIELENEFINRDNKNGESSSDTIDLKVSIENAEWGLVKTQTDVKVERISGSDLGNMKKIGNNPDPQNYTLLENLFILQSKLTDILNGSGYERDKISSIIDTLASNFDNANLQNNLMVELSDNIVYIRDLLLSFFFFEGKRLSEDSGYNAEYVEEVQNNFYTLAGALNDYVSVNNGNINDVIESGEALENYLNSISSQVSYLLESINTNLDFLSEKIAEERLIFQINPDIKEDLIKSTNTFIDLLKSRTDNIEKYWRSIPEGFKSSINEIWLGEATDAVGAFSDVLGTEQEEYMVSLISLQTSVGTGFTGSKLYGLPNFVRSFSEWKTTIQTGSFSEIDSLIRLYFAIEVGLHANGFDPNEAEPGSFAYFARTIANNELIRETKKNMFQRMDIVYENGLTASSINAAISTLVDKEHFIFDANYGKFKISSALITVIPELELLNLINFNSIFKPEMTIDTIEKSELFSEIRFFIFKAIFSGGRLAALQKILKLLRIIPGIKEFSFKTAMVLYIIDDILREAEATLKERGVFNNGTSLDALGEAYRSYYSSVDLDGSNGKSFPQSIKDGIETFISIWVASFNTEDRYIVNLLNDYDRARYLNNQDSNGNNNVPFGYERLYVNPATGFTGIENKIIEEGN